jgi:hypothetical protein
MTINEIITVLQNKLTILQNSKQTYMDNGQLDPLPQLEADIIETQNSLEKLKSL